MHSSISCHPIIILLPVMSSLTRTSAMEDSLAEHLRRGPTEEHIHSFQKHIRKSKRILALCGAGLSAASGISTFRGDGALWRNHQASSISSIEAFEANPGLVWQYLADRRHLALGATPNTGHEALAKLAKKKPGFMCLTQNIDGLSERAGYPKERLHTLHGSLFDIKCTNPSCNYYDKDNEEDPISAALATNADTSISFQPTKTQEVEPVPQTISLKEDETPKLEECPYISPETLDDLASVVTPEMLEEVIPRSKLPHCPKCSSLLRPAVILFGEPLSPSMLEEIDDWIDAEKRLDLMLVIGTMASVYPAANFIKRAKRKGARIVVINIDRTHIGSHEMRDRDWLFEGDAAVLLPILLGAALG